MLLELQLAVRHRHWSQMTTELHCAGKRLLKEQCTANSGERGRAGSSLPGQGTAPRGSARRGRAGVCTRGGIGTGTAQHVLWPGPRHRAVRDCARGASHGRIRVTKLHAGASIFSRECVVRACDVAECVLVYGLCGRHVISLWIRTLRQWPGRPTHRVDSQSWCATAERQWAGACALKETANEVPWYLTTLVPIPPVPVPESVAPINTRPDTQIVADEWEAVARRLPPTACPLARTHRGRKGAGVQLIHPGGLLYGWLQPRRAHRTTENAVNAVSGQHEAIGIVTRAHHSFFCWPALQAQD